MAEEADGRKKTKNWRYAIWGTLALVLGGPALLFFAASALVNSTRLPAELLQPPPDLAALLAPAPAAATHASAPSAAPDRAASTGGDAAPSDADTPQEFAFPVAHQLRIDDRSTTSPRRAHDTYNTFLEAELRERPELEGARIYLDLCGQFQKEDVKLDLNGFSDVAGFKEWLPGQPLPPGCAEWLSAQTEIVSRFLRLGESSGLPVRTREAYESQDGSYYPPSPNFPLLVAGAKILAAEGQRRLEAGDAAGAERYWRAVMRLSANLCEPSAIGLMIGKATLSYAIQPLTSWIGATGAARETMNEWQATLAQAHRYVFPTGLAAQGEAILTVAWRRSLVPALTGPSWREPVFGWDAGEFPWLENKEYLVTLFGVDLPRFDRLTVAALHAMRGKRAAPRILREFDRISGEILRRERMTWPELATAGPIVAPKEDYVIRAIGPNMGPSSIETLQMRLLVPETQLNLLRAAIEWRLAPNDAKPDPATMTIADRESPWRDPFAEAPLRATALPDGSGVLLYSLGPDLTDQHGQTEYDPTNGTVSAGDLALEVRR